MRIAVFAALGAGVLAAACGSSSAPSSQETTPSAADTAPRATANGACRRVKAPPPRRAGGRRAPGALLARSKTYEVVFDTSCGSFTVRLDQRASPRAAASFAALARSGYFDRTTFHRIVPGFVIQGGDPTATGSGGPGYSTRDTPAPGTAYTRGVVAMAKTAAEPPGTAGSQFYVVTGADARLPPEYAVVGRVVRGLTTTKRIDALGDPAAGDAGTPTQPVVIYRARLG